VNATTLLPQTAHAFFYSRKLDYTNIYRKDKMIQM